MTTKVLELFENDQICFFVKSSNVIKSDLRLDPTHYLDDLTITINDEIHFKKLIDFVYSVDEPNLFTRYYCKKQYGIPYISSSEMSEIEPPVDSRYISKELTNNIGQYIIKRGQILVSAAGTVGSIVVATKMLEGVAGTSDILRINVDMKSNLGFIYTYLTSSYGANELSNLAYGAIIKRVRGAQLEHLKTPKIKENLILKMNDLVLLALNKRDEANDFIKKARSLVIQYNNLPTLSEIQLDTLDPEKEVDIRSVKIDEFTSDYRLDAHFYNPMAKMAIDNIKSKSNFLVELCDSITMCDRFNRNYVEYGYGLPFLSGKNTMQIRPELKYISLTETNSIESLKLEKGWITVTRSGTLGRVCYVWNNYENYAATEDLIRVVPRRDIDSGYLFAFLSSDYGYYQLLKSKHGAVIDHIIPEDLHSIIIPICNQQKEIGDLVRQAYDLRAEAIKLEDEAQEILTHALTGK